MCGICGLFDPRGGLLAAPTTAALAAMTASLARRGPDDQGDFADPAGHLRLGFRRLAILDLSAAGHQPMLSASGRSVIVMNGEIYNFPELRRELEADGHHLRSRSDTEVLLEHLEKSGLAILPRLSGMFAFAWYEIAEKRLTLARDPFGIKPLHLHLPGDGRLAFASQLDTLRLGPWASPGDGLNPESLGLFLRLSHLPAPYGFYPGTSQLPPGSFLRCDARGQIERGVYYEFPENETPFRESRAALLDRLEPVLAEATRRHRLADVPLGVFLSGGIDSPLVAAMTRQQTSAELATFTLASPGWDQDEGPAARAYAQALGLTPRVLELDENILLESLDDLSTALTEPLADFSLLPTLLVSRLARQEVKVVLSGDGGDELFFGYERPLSLIRDGAAFAWPRPIRRALYLAGRLRGLFGGRRRSDTITFPTPGDYYLAVNQRFPEMTLRRLAPDLPGLPADFGLYRCPETGDWRDLLRFARRAEIGGQLQRGLKKVDMASMYHGLEARVPLLDRELAALAASIDPLSHLEGPTRELERKTLLRGLLERQVPAALLPQRKLGFSLPLAHLLRGPLRQRVEATLLDQDLQPAGLFRRSEVERLWRSHLRGEHDAKWEIWALLTLQFFFDRKIPGSP